MSGGVVPLTWGDYWNIYDNYPDALKRANYRSANFVDWLPRITSEGQVDVMREAPDYIVVALAEVLRPKTLHALLEIYQEINPELAAQLERVAPTKEKHSARQKKTIRQRR